MLGDIVSIKYISDLEFDVYIKKELIKNINFKNKEDLENYLKKLFKILKNKYDIIVEGFYNITVYIDKYYGIIFHLEKDDLDYYDYFNNQVDMKIIIIDKEFVYEINDIPYEILDKVNIFVNNNKIYLRINKELSNLEMMELLENSKITYNN